MPSSPVQLIKCPRVRALFLLLYPDWVHWFFHGDTEHVQHCLCSRVSKEKYRCQLQIQPLELLSTFSWQFLSHCAIGVSFCISETNTTFINLVLKLALGQENKKRETWGNMSVFWTATTFAWSEIARQESCDLTVVQRFCDGFCLHYVFAIWQMKFHADSN